MSFEDIDTPVSESDLAGDESIVDNDTPVDEELPVEDTPAVEETQAEEVAEEKPERAPVIPRARFDEVNAKLHAEREENERLRAELEQRSQQRQAQAESVDVDTLEQEHFDAMMDGDKERAVSIRARINAELESRAEAKAAARLGQEFSEREQRSSLNAVASKAYESYPFLDVSSDDANTNAINDVVEWRDFYAMKGDPVHVALAKAVEKVGPMYSQPQEMAPVAQDTRKQSAVVRNLKESRQQPPQQSAGIGNRATPPGPKIDTQSDWDKLNTSERERILMGA